MTRYIKQEDAVSILKQRDKELTGIYGDLGGAASGAAKLMEALPSEDAVPVAWIEERISNAKEAGQTLIAQMWQELIDGYNRESK